MSEREGEKSGIAGRRRRGFWLFVAVFLLLCLAYVAFQLTIPSRPELECWMEEMRSEGERFTIKELFPDGFGDHTTNQIAEVERLYSLLAPGPADLLSEVYVKGTKDTALPLWQLRAPTNSLYFSSTNPPPTWKAWQELVDQSQVELDEIYRLLRTPDRDMGDALGMMSTRRPDYVKKRSLTHYLSAVMMIELHRDRPEEGRHAFEALLHWPAWHAEHRTLINQMIRVAISRRALDSQWAILQYPGWSDAQLLQWQRHWQTNSLMSEFSMMMGVGRASLFSFAEQARELALELRS